MYINQVVRDQNLAILAIQEAHLSDERLEALNALFATSLEIHCSPDPENSTGARGVALVVNKRRLAGRKCVIREVVPGRAMQIEYPWSASKSITLLNVYAPNAVAENEKFWTDLRASWTERGCMKPDVVLGDFNVVESALDRYPAHSDPASATEALARMLKCINAHDSWRGAHPTERLFTFRQAGGERQSRLDRIYVKQSIIPKVADWLAVGPGRLSDHQLVICSIANYHAPVVGKGRWSAPLSLLDDAKFVGTMKRMGMDLTSKMACLGERTETENPQLLFDDFKRSLADAARKRVKEWVPKLDKKITHLREQVQALQSADVPSLEENAAAAETVALLQEHAQGGWTRRNSH
ncbi:DNase I-like protein [Trametes versicolor FP-101664 SS1]|uniref:DNase I-like protein n=1 Tax=Trametes versicolor (strain FP-101664) TaxID=717944 RepID=UPI0004621325|nr:DNase I-like protein [Trametes versicolor FP-101664 SS1]EIW55711.1 DNase I-like protein [Trametes versicolor FP-101664 SS1]